MKKILIMGCLLLSICSLFAQNDKDAKKSILSITKKQEAAWNKHDMDAFCIYFTDDATLINFLGLFWKSKSEIVENIHRINEIVFKHSSITMELKKLKVITPDVAIANIEEEFIVKEDYADAGQQYKKGDKNYKLITSVFIRKNNEWKITSAQITLINQFVSPHQK